MDNLDFYNPNSASPEKIKRNGQVYRLVIEKCTCACHKPGRTIIHSRPCCQAGKTYAYMPYNEEEEEE